MEGGGGGTPSEPPIPPGGSDILKTLGSDRTFSPEVCVPQKRWIGETGNHGGHRNVPSRPFSFGILRRGPEKKVTGVLATRSKDQYVYRGPDPRLDHLGEITLRTPVCKRAHHFDNPSNVCQIQYYKPQPSES